jgi:hypothetical protein
LFLSSFIHLRLSCSFSFPTLAFCFIE